MNIDLNLNLKDYNKRFNIFHKKHNNKDLI